MQDAIEGYLGAQRLEALIVENGTDAEEAIPYIFEPPTSVKLGCRVIDTTQTRLWLKNRWRDNNSGHCALFVVIMITLKLILIDV